MFRTILFSTALLALLLAAGPASAKLRVATSVPDLAALTSEVGGDRVHVTSLSLSTQDPHFVDARPNLALALNRADLLIALGADMEVGWLPVLQTGARNSSILSAGDGYMECSNHVPMKEVPSGPIDRGMGDVHAEGNPHYLRDPNYGIKCAEAIAAKLSQLDPEHAGYYQGRFETFKHDLLDRIQEWETQMKPHTGTQVITYHKSWVYLLDWLGFERIGAVEPRPGIPPSPSHVARLLRDAAAKEPKLLLHEEYYPDTTSRLIAERAGIPLLKMPGGTRFRDGQTYAEKVDNHLSMIRKALEKQVGQR